ncbi:MAG: glycosyltransferase family 4 protein [Deltaproteobacteria bacterium]|nr:glycosyltransferase family 4 protein [Deltaproteobacteria bacterium]
MKKVLYVHYQKSDRDGPYIHTREFGRAFAALCREKGTAFSVVEPKTGFWDAGRSPFLARLKKGLARYFLHDLKTLSVQFTRVLRELAMLKRERPDVVLTRYNETTISILWACRKKKIPAALELNAPDSEKLLRRKTYWRVPGMEKLFSIRHAFELSSGAFGVSDDLLAALRESSGSKKPLAVIPNGVNLDRFDPRISGLAVRNRYGFTERTVVVGYVGSFPLFHSMEGLLDRIPSMVEEEPELRFLLVGQVTSYEDWLVRRVKEPRLAPYVILAGFAPPQEIPAYVAAMDIAILPNTAAYCSPLKIFEYMAMARAIVAPATAPVVFVVTHQKEGLLFEPENYGQMAEAILQLARDPDLRARIGAAARVHVAKDFTWRRNAERVYEFLLKVCEQHRERGSQ